MLRLILHKGCDLGDIDYYLPELHSKQLKIPLLSRNYIDSIAFHGSGVP